MEVARISSLNELAAWRDAWDALSGGVPFRSWVWNSTWWRHYQGLGQLYVLCVHEGPRLFALAPWYLAAHPARGRVVRFLASGEVSSDYQSILCVPGREAEATAAIAEWLMRAIGRRADRWDLLDFEGIEAADLPMRQLLEWLRADRCRVDDEPALNCWRLPLPATWEAYLDQLSKSHRGQVARRWRKYFDSGRAQWHTVANHDELPTAFDRLIQLHERRWGHVGQPGVFVSPRFTAFHREAAAKMLTLGQLRLHWLAIDGRPGAAEYHFAGGGVSYLYQGGMEPELFKDNPGNLAHIAAIRGALADGFQAMDFLRGDEPYKPHFRAAPQACLNLRVVPPRASARFRNSAWQTGRRVKHWLNTRSAPRSDLDTAPSETASTEVEA